MAKKLALTLSREQMRMLYAVAVASIPTATGDEQIRWRTIARRAQEALDFGDDKAKPAESET